MLQSICIQLIGALSECIGRDELTEAHVRRTGKIIKDATVPISTNAASSIHLLALRYGAVSTASKMGNLIHSEFSESSVKPLVQSINQTLETSSWYYIAPSIESLQHFINGLPKHLKGMVTKMPALTCEPSLAKMLFTSRLKGKVYCVTSGKTVESEDDASYSVVQESHFLCASFNNNSSRNESWSFLGDKMVQIRSGSKVFVHRDDNGKVLAIVVAPSNENVASAEILSAMKESKFDTHSISSNCTMRLD